ncbi:MAG: LacI family transcriptional regulator [Hyphomicrobiales bacterium]|uniref:LacI family DNA-binding transcriptional regulator n=1 Tax=Rhabdaerophilum calidifontis TaxID=2604328 RepID=UPI00123A9B35|nr:LacI family DNA-binding transcriptional regulator [Rhabdaerophilum calidifontis]MCA1999143.1 LacI family transcriptional regulator [Hyphomicrobiales bacterium]
MKQTQREQPQRDREKPGPRRPRVSLSTIARAAGVSISTVSRIANGQLNRANPQTVARVQALLETTGYRPDNIGRSLRHGRSRIVAMLAPNLTNPAMAAIASATETALREAGYVMILCDTHDEPALQDEYLAAMRSQSVEGYVVVSGLATAMLEAFVEGGEPVVFVGRRPALRGRPAPFVGIDNRGAGAMAADHLLERGLRRFGLIHSATSSSAIEERVAGFRARLAERGVPASAIGTGMSLELQHLFAGYAATRQLVEAGGWPEGLFAVSDLMAYGAYRLAREAGIHVPRDCVIVGIDDNILNAWIAPWLSSVHVPYESFGTAILAQLRARWEGRGGGDALLPYRLVARADDACE